MRALSTGKTSRNKGKVGERKLAAALRAQGIAARRGQPYSGSETSADVVGLPGIHIECKRVEKLNIYDAIEQAQRDAGKSGELPAVFHRRNRKPWLVTMSMDDWFRLYRKWR